MDIVHPPVKELLTKVDSRYTLVVLGAKRARQILEETKKATDEKRPAVLPKVKTDATKDVSNALAEVAADKVSYRRGSVGAK